MVWRGGDPQPVPLIPAVAGLSAVGTLLDEDGYFHYALGRADGTDISALVKTMNAALHGRGGGRNGFAQGSVEAEQGAIEAFFKEK